MRDTNNPGWGFSTIGIRAGTSPGPEDEHSVPIYATSSFVAASAAEAAARFSGAAKGNIYSRFTNPTVQAFERRLAALEGGASCVGTASGMSAILAACVALLKSGDHVVASRTLFGPTINLFNNYLRPFGVETSYVPLTDVDAWVDAITPKTRLLFLETPSNPLTDVADIAALAEVAKKRNCLLVVDNCFCTPALQRPLALGADIVIHSATKYIDGQGRAIGGAVVGDQTLVGEKVFGFLRTAGPSMSPFNAWIFLKGLETLELRMKAHSANAQRLAEWLHERPEVRRVFYPGLPDHPQHALARSQQRDFGGIVSFDLHGGREAAWRLIDQTRMISITANLGDTRSTITHPATTTHGRISAADREAAGVTEGLVRIAVGLENADDIITDLKDGLT